MSLACDKRKRREKKSGGGGENRTRAPVSLCARARAFIVTCGDTPTDTTKLRAAAQVGLHHAIPLFTHATRRRLASASPARSS